MELKEMYLEDLQNVELINIDGGRPTKDTSLGYDIAWFIVTGLMILGEGASSIKG